MTHDKVLGLLDNAIAQVAKASGTVPRDAESSIPLGDRLSQFSVSGGTQRFMSTNAGSTLLGEPSAGTPQDAARELADQVSGVKAPQMKTQNTQLAQMADSAKPIMDSFTRILVSGDPTIRSISLIADRKNRILATTVPRSTPLPLLDSKAAQSGTSIQRPILAFHGLRPRIFGLCSPIFRS